ncbi:sugar phosphate isomerase/epimerase [Telluribacter sp.]|jgi:sugar phosphate isomerase/epimerase|uniref:sugar phosphate isomerase/epimerase family protein n=1 Tax=Telluribacter sp. TaxID=1978767 RepID=UPI002E1045B1|nr:sugar phosphate isomerase/epimerase [Telluribacter sp.]
MTKISRKEFLKAGSLAVASTLLTRFDSFAKPSKPIGLQLYTLRNELGKDVEGTIRKAAEIGYKEVELFGYGNGKFFGKTPKEFAALLKELGLNAPSGHYMTGNTMPNAQGTLTNGWEKAVEDAATIGQKYMVCAFLFPDERKTLDQYKQHIDLFNKAAETCKKSGIQFAYHNHDFEFQPIDGQVPYDLILKGTDPKLVKMELDLYWAAFAGKDPVELFKKDPGRYPLWHIKDMEKSAERAFAEVGTGSIDFQRLFNAQKTAGLKHFFVEQDVAKKNPPLQAIEISFNNLSKLKV